MKTEEILLIRQALTTAVNSLEVRLENTINSFCMELVKRDLDTAKKALHAALRMN